MVEPAMILMNAALANIFVNMNVSTQREAMFACVRLVTNNTVTGDLAHALHMYILFVNLFRCLDIDECVEQQGLCPSPGTCKNTDGSFRCVCPRGYKLDETGTFCIDNNECDDDGRCEEGCTNRPGSYKCGCPEGFQLHLYFNQCVDKDECAGPDNPCGNNKCINTIGSYSCGCPRFAV